MEYVCHRVGNGAHLRDVMQEEYVRRNASPDEIEGTLENPRLVEAAHEKMRDDFSSGRLGPGPSQNRESTRLSLDQIEGKGLTVGKRVCEKGMMVVSFLLQ